MLCASLLICNLLSAQTVITGTVFDNGLQPIAGATVCVIDADENILSATTTDANGNFLLENPQSDYLHVSHVAYEDSYTHAQGAKKVVICLVDKVENLGEVTVVAKRPVLEMKNGNMVANLSQMPNAETADVAKILERIPGVKSNESDGLSLNGKAVTLYIDGRKQNLPEENLIQMLKSMPASSMEQVELVTENDGTYSVETGAVIKLKTKSRAADGVFCTIGGYGKFADKVSADSEHKLSAGSNAFLVVRRKNVTFNTTLSYYDNNSSVFQEDSTCYSNSTIINDRGLSDYRNGNLLSASNLNVGFEKFGNINLNFMLYQNHRKTDATNRFEISRLSADSSHTLLTESKGGDRFITGFIGYTAPESAPFKLNLSYNIANNIWKSESDYFNSDSERTRKELYLNTKPEMWGWQQTGNIDFQYKIDTLKLTVFAGAQIDNNHVNDKIENGTNLIGYNESDFEADEVIAAGYVRLSYDITKKWNLSGALRIEKEWYKAKLKTDDNWFEKEFFYCLPFANITFNPNKNFQAKASLYGSVSRANYDQLYPGARYVTPYSSRVGNPNLEPTLYRGASLSGWLFRKCNIGVSYEKISDYVIGVAKSEIAEQQVVTYMNAYDAKTFQTYFNIFQQFFDDALYVSFNAFVLHNSLLAKNGFTILDGFKNYWKGEGEFDVDYDLTDNISVSTCLWYQPQYKGLQEKMRPLWSFDIGLYFNFLDESLAIAVEAEDLFRTMKSNYETYFDGNVSHTKNVDNSRFVKLSVTYKFFRNRDVSGDARYENGVIGRGRFNQSK